MSEDMDHLTRLKTSEKIYSAIQLVVSAIMIAVSLLYFKRVIHL